MPDITEAELSKLTKPQQREIIKLISGDYSYKDVDDAFGVVVSSPEGACADAEVLVNLALHDFKELCWFVIKDRPEIMEQLVKDNARLAWTASLWATVYPVSDRNEIIREMIDLYTSGETY